MNEVFLATAKCPVLISSPHAGTHIPESIRSRFKQRALELPDTDWYIDQVWDIAVEHGAGLLIARNSRYVVDLNRPPDDQPLYTREGTGLIPLTTFEGQDIYLPGAEPGAADRKERLDRHWRPYHRILRNELDRLVKAHGYAILIDAHSIRSNLPRLFEGRLDALNLGSHDGKSAARDLIVLAKSQFDRWDNYRCVLDGRFKGGYITRHYGRPDKNVHALQLEMAQRVYMQENPPRLLPAPLANVRVRISEFLETLLTWRSVDE